MSYLARAGLVLVGLVLSAPVFAAGQVTELRFFRAEDWLRAEVDARDLLDEPTRLTIDSGLPGTCLYQLLLQDRDGRVVLERYIERTLRFDLWEEQYLLEQEGVVQTLPDLAASDSALCHVADCGLCPLVQLSEEMEYRIVVQIAVRPLAPEDRRRLSRYVSRTSGSGQEEVMLDLSVLFNGILGEKSKTRPTVMFVGPYFRIAELKEAP